MTDVDQWIEDQLAAKDVEMLATFAVSFLTVAKGQAPCSEKYFIDTIEELVALEPRAVSEILAWLKTYRNINDKDGKKPT